MNNSWNEAAKSSWDKRANYWHANSREMWENGSRKEIIPFFTSHVPKGKVVDLGCGDGYGSLLLHKEGYDVTGVDLSEEMIRIARNSEKKGLSFFTGDLNNLPFRASQFDSVLAINSLEWTENPFHALNEIHRITVPAGYACFGILGPTAKPRDNSFPRLLGEKVICNTMMPWEFARLALENGWRIIAEKGVYKRGVDIALICGLSNELKQALTFMNLFMLQRKE